MVKATSADTGSVWIDRVTLSRPLLSDKDKTTVQRKIYPSEARERLTTYRAKLTAVIKWNEEGDKGEVRQYEEVKECGLLPVMVRVSESSISWIQDLSSWDGTGDGRIGGAAGLSAARCRRKVGSWG